MKVGGRDFNLTKEEVEARMHGELAEGIQKYVVEVRGAVFPPKQVLGHVTGWPRTSFTTMEAQRVLTKLGFTCREARAGRWIKAGAMDGPEAPDDVGARLAAVEAALATAQEAIAGLGARVRILESQT